MRHILGMGKNNQTSITPNSRKELPDRGKGKRTLMLDAIRAVSGTEEEFLEAVVRGALEGGVDGTPNTALMSLVMQRVSPPFKSTMPMVEFTFDVDATPAVQAAQVMHASSQGLLAPDIANMFISSISAMLKIEEVTTLKSEIEQIKKMLEVQQ